MWRIPDGVGEFTRRGASHSDEREWRLASMARNIGSSTIGGMAMGAARVPACTLPRWPHNTFIVVLLGN